MTHKEAIRDLNAIKDYFEQEGGAYPVSLEYAIKVLKNELSADMPQKVIAQVAFDEEKLREIVKEAVERFKEEYEIADRPQEWIPCSERLPSEEKATYLVCTDSECMCSCRWTNVNPFWTDHTTEWHWCIFDIPQYSKVVAWMPLPKPWKGADDE